MPDCRYVFRIRKHAGVIAASALIIFLVMPLSVVGPRYSTYAVAKTQSSSAQNVQMYALEWYGKWTAGSETPLSIISIVQSLRSSIDNTPINIWSLFKNIQQNNEIVDGSGFTLNNWLNQVKSAAGGDIIPELNLDLYTNDQDIYVNPQNSSDYGPAFFYQTSEEFLSLSAIEAGSKTVLLDSWPTFYRYAQANNGYVLNPPYTDGYDQTMAQVFQELQQEGWQRIIIKQIGPSFQPDPGYTWGQVTTPWKNATTSSPYMFPQTYILNQVPSSQQKFLYFDRQDKNGGTSNDETALQHFLIDYDSSQQAAILTNLADLQSSEGYSFVYPVLTYTSYSGSSYTWDASTRLQANGQPFLSLIESLMGGGSTTSTTATGSSSSTSSLGSQSGSSTATTTSSANSSSIFFPNGVEAFFGSEVVMILLLLVFIVAVSAVIYAVRD